MTLDISAAFNAEFTKAIEQQVADTGFPVEQWFRGGVTKPETMVEQWRERGPKVVQNYIDWYESSGWEVWITPDGQPAVELEINVTFGRIPVQMFVDSVLYKAGVLMVQDLKTSASVPETMEQVSLYACGIELKYGVRPLLGSYFMARGVGKNKDIFLTDPKPLTGYENSIAYWTQQFEAAERVIEAGQADGLYVANKGKHCERCDVAHACAAVSGGLAKRYDSTHPEFTPF